MGSDIPFSSCTTIWRTCKVDGDFKHGNGKIEINGHIYEKGIVQHAAGVAKFTLRGEYTRFSSCIGIVIASFVVVMTLTSIVESLAEFALLVVIILVGVIAESVLIVIGSEFVISIGFEVVIASSVVVMVVVESLAEFPLLVVIILQWFGK